MPLNRVETVTAEGPAFERHPHQRKRPRPNQPGAFTISGARDRARTGDPHVGKEMLGLISLRFFAQSGHIDAFRSIVGERLCASLLQNFGPPRPSLRDSDVLVNEKTCGTAEASLRTPNDSAGCRVGIVHKLGLVIRNAPMAPGSLVRSVNLRQRSHDPQTLR